MSWWEALLLGIIQGLTEFLPVSSSGHIALFQDIFVLNGNALFTSVALHFGTLCAVVMFYFKDLCVLFKKENRKTIVSLVIASIPAGLVMLIFKSSIENLFSSSKFLCFGFLLTAIMLLFAEFIGKRIKK